MEKTTSVDWRHLTSEEQLGQILEESKMHPVIIFKHSTRCGISSMALDRLERHWDDKNDMFKPYLLDLLSYRNLSNAISERLNVPHQSPQIILIKNGEARYHTSHLDISFQNLQKNS